MDRIPPNRAKLNAYSVNRANEVEAIYQPLYDYQTYDTGGYNSLSFFQSPVGQSGKTREDTNLDVGSAIPAGQEYLITGIQVMYYPGNVVAGDDVSIVPAGYNWQDVYDLMKSGVLTLSIGSKNYLVDGPLGKFPPEFRLAGTAHVEAFQAAAADQNISFDYAVAAGRVYTITPVKLMANQNFAVTLEWPNGKVTQTAAGRIGVIFTGYLYRLSQ